MPSLQELPRVFRWAFFFVLFSILIHLAHFFAEFEYDENEYVTSDDIYFEILNPDSLKYTYKARLAQNFGKPFSKPIQAIPLVPAEPINGCNSFVNKLEIKNNVILVERGGCSFLAKCINAELNDVAIILVYDSNMNNDDQYIDMVDDMTSRNCSIPAAFILGRDGSMIRRQMMYLGIEQVLINIPVNTSISVHRNPPWSLY